jgi:23S rRNA (cytosine1962-C5)-methyltransferase
MHREPIVVYQLVDFGNGRKLERFARILIDRPCPVATDPPETDSWSAVDGRFEVTSDHRGKWHWYGQAPPTPWRLETCFGQMELFPGNLGHVGVFMEQQRNWRWLTKCRLSDMKILNLFAYTGGSTLAAAASGASVTHVDAAKNIVRRASKNATLSGLADRPIRWIVEDAAKFVRREVRRGNRYDGIIFDPPTYGHGVSANSTWKIREDLSELICLLGQLLENCQLLLFTCHTAGYSPGQMQSLVEPLRPPKECEAGPMFLESITGRQLPAGHFVRWCRDMG